jgi:hypothetical protein
MPVRDRQKFVELANKRVNNALKAVQLIGNLSNKSNYSYTEDDVEKIFSVLTKELKSCRERFGSSGSRNERKFNLE